MSGVDNYNVAVIYGYEWSCGDTEPFGKGVEAWWTWDRNQHPDGWLVYPMQVDRRNDMWIWSEGSRWKIDCKARTFFPTESAAYTAMRKEREEWHRARGGK